MLIKKFIDTIVFAESKGQCGSPQLIKNGVAIFSTLGPYENGSSVEYRCYEHHFLHGSRKSYCMAGTWTTPPSCLGMYYKHVSNTEKYATVRFFNTLAQKY